MLAARLQERREGEKINIKKIFLFFLLFAWELKQNAVAAAAAAPYPGQYAGFEAYPYTTAAAAAGMLITSIKGDFLAVWFFSV